MKNYHDIAGDGGSDILQQVEAQAETVARSLSGVRNLLATVDRLYERFGFGSWDAPTLFLTLALDGG